MSTIMHVQFGDNDSGIYNKEYLVVRCKTHFSRAYSNHAPSCTPSCQSIDVTIVAPDKEDLELYEWFVNNSTRSGRIVHTLVDITNKGTNQVERVVTFDDAQVFMLNETYDKNVTRRREVTLSIAPRQCTIENINFLQQTADYL